MPRINLHTWNGSLDKVLKLNYFRKQSCLEKLVLNQGGGGYSLNRTYHHIAELTHFWGRGVPTEKVGVSTSRVLTPFRVGVPYVYFDFDF